MTAMPKEEEGRLQRQLTTAEVRDGVRNDSKHSATVSRAGERRESVEYIVNGFPSHIL